jgi:hypothetical protein
MPLVSRDEIKEGYVNTFGVRHDELPADANGRATDLFFELVNEHLSRGISIIIEAAFKHPVWEYRMPAIVAVSDPLIILCAIDDAIAAKRYLERGIADPEREFYHGDNMVVHYRKTGEVLPFSEYSPPNLRVPTLSVSTEGKYVPSIEEIVDHVRSMR